MSYILVINLDIQIDFRVLFFRVTCSSSANNTPNSDMSYTTLQDPFWYFLHYRLGTDQVFWFGYGSDFGLWVVCQ